MDNRTRDKHITALELALQYFKGQRCMLKDTTVTALLENAGIAWAMLNHEANRMDALALGYASGKLDAKEETAHLRLTARKIDFPNIERGMPLGDVAEG